MASGGSPTASPLRTALGTFAVALAAAGGLVAGEGDPPIAPPAVVAIHRDVVAPWLEANCAACHDGADAAAGLDIAALASEAAGRPAALLDATARWRRLVAAVEAGVMPPADAGEPPANRDGIVRAIEAALDDAAERAPIRLVATAPRRLSRAEWVASVESVFGVTVDAERWLPPDEPAHGFPHLVDAQTTSPARIQSYLEAAEHVARRVVVSASPERPIRIERRGDDLAIVRGSGGRHGEVAVLATNGEVGTRVEIPRTGRYEIEAVVFGQQAGPDPARVRIGRSGGPSGAVKDVPERSDAPGVRLETLALDAGSHDLLVSFVNDYWNPRAADPRDRDRNLGVVAIRVQGPLADGLGPIPRPSIDGLGDPAVVADPARRRDLVTRTLERAWRHPVDEDVVEPFAAWMGEVASEHGAEEASRAFVAAVVASPNFLHLVEGRDDDPDGPDLIPVSQHEFATRLAYALTSAPPDARLRDLAARGELIARRGEEVDRLLAGPARSVLVDGFLLGWLELIDLQTRRVDGDRFPEVRPDLVRALLEETRRALALAIAEDRPLPAWFDESEGFLDAALARHYGLDERYAAAAPTPDGWRRVDLTGTGRPGLLGHGSVMLWTSEGGRTSPSRRGRWLLDVLFGQSPPPAPPEVPSLDAAARADGPDTLRDRLARHRADPACASCHVRMDPLGFALERFDALGRLRPLEPGPDGEPGDRGVLPDGRVVDGVVGLRSVVRDAPALKRRFAARLLAWCLGRGIGPADEPLVRDVVRYAEAREDRFSAYVHGVVESAAFRWRVARGREER